MSYKRVLRLVNQGVRERAAEECWNAPEGAVVRFGEAGRSLDQNAAQWPILQAFSEQLEWPVNGRMVKMTPDEWKDVLSAAFQNEQARLAMGLDGGVVMLGLRTSKMGKRQFSEWLEFLHATAAEREVVVYADEAA
ncbi:MAG: recombination protein NinB [Sulfuricaulis sp.]|nr:recombination protein NinB [Sulfuricaulis sp.]